MAIADDLQAAIGGHGDLVKLCSWDNPEFLKLRPKKGLWMSCLAQLAQAGVFYKAEQYQEAAKKMEAAKSKLIDQLMMQDSFKPCHEPLLVAFLRYELAVLLK
ncbi:hypothetical protein KIPB_013707, partial [Kipferlia bialata]|eukprot:g13707.t1